MNEVQVGLLKLHVAGTKRQFAKFNNGSVSYYMLGHEFIIVFGQRFFVDTYISLVLANVSNFCG